MTGDQSRLKRLTNGEFVLAILVASLFWIAVLVWATSYSPTDPEKEACYQAAAKSGHSTEECKSFWEKATSDPIAMFTFVLASSTIGLWGATIGLYLAGEKQFRLARDEFVSTHRPKLIVRQFQLDAPKPDTAIRLRFSVLNVGNTEGTVRFIVAEAALWNGKYWEAPGIDPIVKPFGPRTIRNGERISVAIESRFKITDAQIKAVEMNALIICAVGEFTYTDRLGTERRIGFRRNYDVSTDMFVASQNTDQEYQD
jgi:hypothetical protein